MAVTIHHPITKDHKLEVQNAIDGKKGYLLQDGITFAYAKESCSQLKNIICVSQYSKEDIFEFKVDEKNNNVPNGIDIGTFKPSSIKSLEL